MKSLIWKGALIPTCGRTKYGNSVNGDAPTRITDCESIKTGIRRVLDYILRQCIKHASEQELSQQLCCLGCFRMKT